MGLHHSAPTGPTLAVASAPMSPCEAAPRPLALPRSVLLDSDSANGHGDRCSYLATAPFLKVRSRGRRVGLVGPAGRTVVEVDPFDLLRSLMTRYTLPQQPGLPRLLGGAVAYFDYDLGRLLESLPATNPADERRRIHPSQYAPPEACGRGASSRSLVLHHRERGARRTLLTPSP